jgi:hypothetical protein
VEDIGAGGGELFDKFVISLTGLPSDSENAPMSLVTALRTIRIAERPNLVWVEIETDDGRTGLGESFRGAQAVEAVLHEQVAPFLVGRDARHIEAVSRHLMTPYLGFHSASAEVRAASSASAASRSAPAAMTTSCRQSAWSRSGSAARSSASSSSSTRPPSPRSASRATTSRT